MNRKITNILSIINTVIKKINPNFIFDYTKNTEEYDDDIITQLFEALPQLVERQYSFKIIEGKNYKDSGFTPIFRGTSNITIPKESKYFNETIPMNFNNYYDMLIHEFAHAIDSFISLLDENAQSNYYSINKNLITKELSNIQFITSIPNNVNTYLVKSGYNVNINPKNDINAYKYSCLLDILDALGNGVLHQNYIDGKRDNTAVSKGHGSDFTDKNYNKIPEIMADFISMKILCPESIDYLRKDFPKLVYAIEETINCMLND